MQKSKLATIIIIAIILIYGLLANFKLIYEINAIYWNIINPLFWLILSAVLFFAFGKNYDNKSYS